MDKLAIVILNWNGLDMLRTYMPSVMRYSRDEAKVYVADNASTDGSVDFLREQYPEVELILLERNWGFAEGYNRALAQVEGEYYLLLNSDIEVTQHWLTPLIAYMDSHPDVAACQPKLLSAVAHDSFEYAGAAGGYIDRLGYPYCRGRLFDTVERDTGQYDQPADIHWATGAALLMRARIYNIVGGLDPRFFAHNEEIDLCWRVRLLGYRIVCLPDSTVYHLGGGTLPKGNPMKTYLNFRNNLTMLYKCLPDDSLRAVMRWRWLLDRVAAWQTLIINRNVADFRAIYRARRDFRRWRDQFAADRHSIQASRHAASPSNGTSEAAHDTSKAAHATAKPANSTTNLPELSPFSLLWQYYAKGRKLFSLLPRTL